MAGLAVQVDDRAIPLGNEGPFVVGRGAATDLTLTNTLVSRQHLVLTGLGEAWSGCDMGTSSGTYLDGERLDPGVPFPLVPGMELMLGHPQRGVALRVVGSAPPEGDPFRPARDFEPPASSDQPSSWCEEIDPGAPVIAGDHQAEQVGAEGGDLASVPAPVAEAATCTDPVPTESVSAASLIVSRVSYRIADRKHADRGGKLLLDDVSFQVPHCSLLAVIGPSGAGKSTLLKAITGKIKPASGTVIFDRADMSAHARLMIGRVGMVPQEDLVHRQLTVRQALDYAADLRFSDDTTRAERRAAVAWAINELGLNEQAGLKVRNLSGGQRKRVSVAMELITRPDLLLLDEPTSGLDPNLDLEVMEMLAELAHGSGPGAEGRTVIVVTHSTENLDKADNVLLLAPGGRVAYFGPPQGLVPHFAQRHRDVSWAAIYARLNADPVRAAEEFAAGRSLEPVDQSRLQRPRRTARAARRWFLPQAVTLLRRQTRLMLTDPYSGLFTVALPIAIATLVLLVRAPEGLLPAIATDDVGKPRSLLVVLAFGSVAMGLVPSVRQLVTERVIYQHEASAGVRASAYLASKVLLLGVVSAIQAALLISVALQLTAHPEQGVFTDVWTELWVASFLMSWTCAVLGLFLSGIVATAEQVMPLMVMALMLQLVLGGGVLPTIAPGISQLSWLEPGRWGMAAEASTLDFNTNITCRAEVLLKATEDREVNKKAKEATDRANKKAADQAKDAGLPKPKAQKPQYRHTVVDCATVDDQDPLWVHDRRTWLFDLMVLAGWFAAYLIGTWITLIRRAR